MKAKTMDWVLDTVEQLKTNPELKNLSVQDINTLQHNLRLNKEFEKLCLLYDEISCRDKLKIENLKTRLSRKEEMASNREYTTILLNEKSICLTVSRAHSYSLILRQVFNTTAKNIFHNTTGYESDGGEDTLTIYDTPENLELIYVMIQEYCEDNQPIKIKSIGKKLLRDIRWILDNGKTTGRYASLKDITSSHIIG